MRPLASGSRSRFSDSSEGGVHAGRPSASERAAPETHVPGFWLSRCEGFRVDDRRGPLGFVESVIPGHPRGPSALIVAESLPGGRRHYVPVRDVGVVHSVAERVVLRTSFPNGREKTTRDRTAAQATK